ncbi:hypothetical protein [Alteromonas gracilis]|uniref:hypothetical protein n=1 Tax=Alteromonas gracilis TaxID=1479524 RepID=UPI0030CB5412
MRIISVVIALMALTGCQMLKGLNDKALSPQPSENTQTLADAFCFFEQPPASFEYNCDPAYWLSLWLTADATQWNKRKASIKDLGTSEFDRLQAYIYTLPNDTPYQDRLRAQLAVNDMLDKFTPTAQRVVSVIASQQNTLLMELESALVVLEKENTSRAQQLEALTGEADNLRTKLEELLQIEATLMDKNRSTQQ